MGTAGIKTKTPTAVTLFIFVCLFLGWANISQASSCCPPVHSDPANLVTATAAKTTDIKKILKENVWDAAAWVLAKTMVHQVSQSIVEWANGGFDGEPTFITNFGDVVENSANQATGVILEKLNTAGLNMCGEFKPNIEMSFKYTKAYRLNMRCTINDVIGNVEDFYNNFEEGGWKTWFALTMEPQNSPYGAYFTTWAEYQKAVEQKKAEKINQAIAGKGFNSPQKCRSGKTGPNGVCYEFNLQTPARTIADRIGQITGIDIDQLNLADEFSEILAAVVGNLTKKVFEGNTTSDTGLATYSPSPGALENELAIRFESIWTEAQSYHDLANSPTKVGAVTRPLVSFMRQQVIKNYNRAIRHINFLISSIKNNRCKSTIDPACARVATCREGAEERIRELVNIITDLIKYQIEKFERVADQAEARRRLALFDEFLRDIRNFWIKIDNIKTGADTDRDGEASVEELRAAGLVNKNVMDLQTEWLKIKDEFEKDQRALEESSYLAQKYATAARKCDPSYNPSTGTTTPSEPECAPHTGSAPPIGAIRPSEVVWLHASPLNFPVNATLSEVRIGGGLGNNPREIAWQGSRPAWRTSPDGSIDGNIWVIMWIDDKWQGATFEWLLAGQENQMTVLDGVGEDPPFMQAEAAPVETWCPVRGEEIGFMLSSMAREGAQPDPRGRSNIIKVEWP